MANNHVRILIPADDATLHDERVWAVPHASIPNVYRIDNVPLSPCGIAYHDWVECTPSKRKGRGGKIPLVRGVYQSGGYGMVFVDINKEIALRAPIFMSLLDALTEQDWPLEFVRDGFWMIVAIPPGQQKNADAVFARFTDVKFSWLIDPLLHDPMQHPAALPVSVQTLTDAWTALTNSFKASEYSPHDDLSEETRAALRQLDVLLAPLMNDKDEADS